MTFETIQVTGNYNSAVTGISGGTPATIVPAISGYVLFTPTSDLVDVNTGIIYKAIGVKAPIVNTGNQMEAATVVTNDSSDLVPVNPISNESYTWLWEIQEVLSGQNPNTWWAEITSTMGSGGSVDLTQLTRLPQPTIG